MDPDPGGPKPCGSDGSGSATLYANFTSVLNSDQDPYDSEVFVPPRSASGSVSQRDGSVDPDLHQENVKNPEHWLGRKASVDGGGEGGLVTLRPRNPTPPTHSALLFINNLEIHPQC